ncbi:MAG: N-acetylmuramoyl-L-alanine amidase family protein, partial [Deinococcus sp.]
ALPASTPSLAGSADRTRLTAGTVAGVALPGQGLGAPRIGKNPGLTRLVLDLPPGSSFRLTPLPLGLRVDITGVSVLLDSAALGISPELLSWSYSPALAGVSVTLNTPTPISPRSGWRDVLLPPVEGSSLSRLAIDLSPALADTTPLGALALAPLPLRVGGPLAFSGSPNVPTVVLDPGHGGSDPGAIGVVVEKAVTLDVALRVRAYLEAAGVRVIMTRDRDVALNPDKAADLSLRAALGTGRARLFVSIHANSTEASSALRGYGVETWYNRNDPDSPALAALIQRDVTLVTAASSRGTKDFRSLAVLRESRIPAALVEIGYTSHPIDGQNLHDGNYLQRVAYGLAQGIRDALAGGIGGK